VCHFCQHVYHRKDKLREHFFRKHGYIDSNLGAPACAKGCLD
jgi:hypothetical protein